MADAANTSAAVRGVVPLSEAAFRINVVIKVAPPKEQESVFSSQPLPASPLHPYLQISPFPFVALLLIRRSCIAVRPPSTVTVTRQPKQSMHLNNDYLFDRVVPHDIPQSDVFELVRPS